MFKALEATWAKAAVYLRPKKFNSMADPSYSSTLSQLAGYLDVY